jgi:Cdc6-like AAA superfamily ATPase
MSAKGLSYRDAVRILGGEQNPVISSLDKVLGGLLLVIATVNPGVLPLLEAKDEFIGLSQDLWRKLAEKTNGLSQLDKTQRISAAHAVIVVSSYFEAIRLLDDRGPLLKIRLPGPGEYVSSGNLVSPTDVWPAVPEAVTITLMRAYRRQLAAEKERIKENNPRFKTVGTYTETQLDRKAQVSLATRRRPESAKLRSVVTSMLNAGLPIPAPQRPYETTLSQLGEFYGNLAQQMQGDIVSEEWDKTDADEWSAFTRAFQGWVRKEALAKYEISFRRLAVEFPEVAFWANMTNFQAIQREVCEVREQLRSLEEIQVGLQGLENAFRGFSAPLADVHAKNEALANYYQTALRRPIVESGELPAEGMRIPDLEAAYINPNFKASDVDPSDAFYTESWWSASTRETRTDLQKFFFGYLKSPEAVNVPILVLGQPGSGKSVLTKAISARLPREEFLVVRVSLREVAAEADIQVQIEQAIFHTTGDRVSWPELVRGSGDVIPVVILDGFDELLQATGVSQSDYLERVAMFQERELANSRPCVVMVTSRTAVADRARVPMSGMAVVRLEPFDQHQIALWLGVWNSWNAEYFLNHNLKELQLGLVLSHGELASQPLLLLMLALYDADGNALEEYTSGLGHAQLYERLIVRFSERDVRKIHSTLPYDQIRLQIERDLMQLSIAAAAMFNRSRQWVTEDELNEDLAALTDRRGRMRKPATSNFQPVRSQGESVLGQFFFIHEARAVVSGVKKGSFEFLHATFGEFLVARIVARELDDLVKSEEFISGMARHDDIRDAFLYSLLSFSPLSARATTIDFLSDLIDPLPSDRRESLQQLLLQLLQVVLETRSSREFEAYEPIPLNSPARYATYSANLVILALLVKRQVKASDLFATSDDVVDDWRRLSLLWRSQLSPEGWQWLSESIEVVRTEHAGRRDLVLRAAFTSMTSDHTEDLAQVSEDDLCWVFDIQSSEHTTWRMADSPTELIQRYRFTCSLEDEIIIHALKPIFDHLGFSMTIFSMCSDVRSVSCANAFVRLWVLSASRAPSGDLAEAYDDCINFCLPGGISLDDTSLRKLRDIVVRQLRGDLKRLPGLWRSETQKRLQGSSDYESEAGPWIDSLVDSLGLRQ